MIVLRHPFLSPFSNYFTIVADMMKQMLTRILNLLWMGWFIFFILLSMICFNSCQFLNYHLELKWICKEKVY